MYVAIVDTETTGVAHDDEAISVGILLLEIESPTGLLIRRVGQYLGFREPRKTIHPAAARVHGLTREELAGKSFDVREMERLVSQAEVLVAHNAEFDARMLLPHVPTIGEKEWRCSWRQYPWIVDLPNKKLDTVCAYLGVERIAPHNALLDCVALAECLIPHSGKTERSRTYFGKLLASRNYGPSLGFDAVRPARATPAHEEAPRRPTAVALNFAQQDEEYCKQRAAQEYKREQSNGWPITICALFGLCLLAVLFVELVPR